MKELVWRLGIWVAVLGAAPSALGDCVNLSGKWRSIDPWSPSHFGGDAQFDCREPDPYPELIQSACGTIQFDPSASAIEIGKTYQDSFHDEGYDYSARSLVTWQDSSTMAFEIELNRLAGADHPEQRNVIRGTYRLVGERLEYAADFFVDGQKRCWQKDTLLRDPH